MSSLDIQIMQSGLGGLNLKFSVLIKQYKKTILAELALPAHNGLTRARCIRFFFLNLIPCWSIIQQPLDLRNWLSILFRLKSICQPKIIKKAIKLFLIDEMGSKITVRWNKDRTVKSASAIRFTWILLPGAEQTGTLEMV